MLEYIFSLRKYFFVIFLRTLGSQNQHKPSSIEFPRGFVFNFLGSLYWFSRLRVHQKTQKNIFGDKKCIPAWDFQEFILRPKLVIWEQNEKND